MTRARPATRKIVGGRACTVTLLIASQSRALVTTTTNCFHPAVSARCRPRPVKREATSDRCEVVSPKTLRISMEAMKTINVYMYCPRAGGPLPSSCAMEPSSHIPVGE